jgi:hypothetical protein
LLARYERESRQQFSTQKGIDSQALLKTNFDFKGKNMRFPYPCLLLVLAWFTSSSAVCQNANPQSVHGNGGDFSNNSQPPAKVPSGVILVKGASSSASDSVTPVPEDGSVANNLFSDPYFGITYPLPHDWMEKYKGPPPSDRGRYVLAQLNPSDTFKGPARGSILITAEDLFFTPLPASNSMELINYSKDNLQADYKVEMPPMPTNVADHPFTFFAYWSPVAQLHWYVLATDIRCHAVQIVLTSRDTKLLEGLVQDLSKMKLSAGGSSGDGAVPVCIKNYARDENVIARVNPVFTERHFNSVPVRIIIDKEGKVKHVHFLSAFPDQAKVISDALWQWRFKPYRNNGQPVEVETGIMFGRSVQTNGPRAADAAVE